MIRTIEVARASRVAIVTVTAGLAAQLLPAPAAASPGDQIVAPALIAPASFVGRPSAETTTIAQPALIASQAAILPPRFVVGGVEVSPALISAGAIVRAPVAVLVPADEVTSPGIPAGSIVSSPSIALEGAQAIGIAAITSGAWVRAPLIAAGAAQVIPSMLAASSAVRAPSLAAGAANVAPAAVASAANVPSPNVALVSVAYDPDTQAALAAMSVQPNAARTKLYDDLLVGLKADGVFPLLDWLIMCAAHDAQAGRVNLVNPSRIASAINSPTFTVDRGYTGDGGTAYLSTGQAWGTSSSKFSRNDAALGVWVNVAGARSQTSPIGMEGTNNSQLVLNSSGNHVMRLNTTGSSSGVSDPSPRAGNRVIIRRDAANISFYTNGQFLEERPSTSVNPSSAAGSILRGSGTYADDGVAAAYAGAALSAAQIAALHTRLSTFLTAIGAA